jgi:hypothetical protein
MKFLLILTSFIPLLYASVEKSLESHAVISDDEFNPYHPVPIFDGMVKKFNDVGSIYNMEIVLFTSTEYLFRFFINSTLFSMMKVSLLINENRHVIGTIDLREKMKKEKKKIPYMTNFTFDTYNLEPGNYNLLIDVRIYDTNNVVTIKKKLEIKEIPILSEMWFYRILGGGILDKVFGTENLNTFNFISSLFNSTNMWDDRSQYLYARKAQEKYLEYKYSSVESTSYYYSEYKYYTTDDSNIQNLTNDILVIDALKPTRNARFMDILDPTRRRWLATFSKRVLRNIYDKIKDHEFTKEDMKMRSRIPPQFIFWRAFQSKVLFHRLIGGLRSYLSAEVRMLSDQAEKGEYDIQKWFFDINTKEKVLYYPRIMFAASWEKIEK